MLRAMFLTTAAITVPFSAFLFDFRKSSDAIRQVVFVSAENPDVQTQIPVTHNARPALMQTQTASDEQRAHFVQADAYILQTFLTKQSKAVVVASDATIQNATGTIRSRPNPTHVKNEIFYVVKSGDSLATISYRYYGRTDGYLQIFEANKNHLSSVNNIEVGQKLIIPQI